ncbi:UrcA family protein [Sphingomonas parva]|nr:UrcA family protein [Sphingomonas parva]
MIKYAVSALAAFTLATGAFAGPALAEEKSATVRIGDLDLSTTAGNAQLERRLRGAATEICGQIAIVPLQFRTMAQACHEEVMASSREQVALAAARAQSKVRLARRMD